MKNERASTGPQEGLHTAAERWLKPVLVRRVKFLKGEEKLPHTSLKDFRETSAI